MNSAPSTRQYSYTQRFGGNTAVNIQTQPSPSPVQSGFAPQQPQPPQEKIKLAENKKDRETYDSLADLYSIILTVEKLERAYVKDAIKSQEYHEECTKLIGKFKALKSMLGQLVPSIEQFMAEYQLDCPAAKHRLTMGFPATVEHGGRDKNETQGKLIAETVQYFITSMDNLRLNMTSQDAVQPLIHDLVDAINRNDLKNYDDHKDKLKRWLVKLNGMSAHQSLEDTEVRQLLFDLESAYNQFHKSLS